MACDHHGLWCRMCQCWRPLGEPLGLVTSGETKVAGTPLGSTSPRSSCSSPNSGESWQVPNRVMEWLEGGGVRLSRWHANTPTRKLQLNLSLIKAVSTFKVFHSVREMGGPSPRSPGQSPQSISNSSKLRRGVSEKGDWLRRIVQR